MDGLIIDEPYLGDILRRIKTWEMRSQNTTKRGRIALIRKGSGHIVGYADLVDVLSPLNNDNYSQFFDKHRVSEAVWRGDGFKWYTPWVLENVEKLKIPIPYKHKSGAVTWVKLDETPDTINNGQINDRNSIDRSRSAPRLTNRKKRVALWRTGVAAGMVLIAMISILLVIVSVPLAIIGGIFSAKLFFSCLFSGGLCAGFAGLLDPAFEFKTK